MSDLDESFVLAFRTRHSERGLNALARAAEHWLDWFFAARAGHSADDSLHALLGKNGPAGRLTLGYRRRAAAPPERLQALILPPRPMPVASLYDSIKRSSAIILAGLMLAFLAGLFLARRMVVPIQILRAGAQRIGGVELVGETLEFVPSLDRNALAQVADMANRLQDSYSGLERKVELRTPRPSSKHES